MSMENASGLHYFFSIALLLIVTIDHCECDQGSFQFLAERWDTSQWNILWKNTKKKFACIFILRLSSLDLRRLLSPLLMLYFFRTLLFFGDICMCSTQWTASIPSLLSMGLIWCVHITLRLYASFGDQLSLTLHRRKEEREQKKQWKFKVSLKHSWFSGW